MAKKRNATSQASGKGGSGSSSVGSNAPLTAEHMSSISLDKKAKPQPPWKKTAASAASVSAASVSAVPAPKYAKVASMAEAETACAALEKCSFLVVDCEGVDLGRENGKLCLVQIAGNDLPIYLFDVFSGPEMLPHLNDLLSDVSVSVVNMIHDCRMDVLALRDNGVRCEPVLGTQVVLTYLSGKKPQHFSL